MQGMALHFPHPLRSALEEVVVISNMRRKSMEKIKIENHAFSGGAWIAAWMFTLGYLHLTFWQGVWALLIWPYYLGVSFSPLLVQ